MAHVRAHAPRPAAEPGRSRPTETAEPPLLDSQSIPSLPPTAWPGSVGALRCLPTADGGTRCLCAAGVPPCISV